MGSIDLSNVKWAFPARQAWENDLPRLSPNSHRSGVVHAWNLQSYSVEVPQWHSC